MAEDSQRWAVVYVVKGATTRRLARLVVEGVPAGVKQAEVIELLEAAGQHIEFTEHGVPWANVQVQPESRWHADTEGVDDARRLSWADVEAGGPERRVTFRLTSGLHAAATLAAQRAGLSLNTWALTTLAQAAGYSQPSSEPRRPIRRAKDTGGSGSTTTRRPAAPVDGDAARLSADAGGTSP